VKQAHEDLTRRIAALRTRFAEVGARAAAAARAVTATSLPPERLLEDLNAVGAEFAEVRAAVLEQAAILPRPPAPSSITRLRDLESVAAALVAAEEERVRQSRWDVARENAAAVLDRVRTLIHREDREFPGLAECQAKARELEGALGPEPPADLAERTTMLEARLRPFIALVTLVEGWNRLDDDRCAALQDVIAQTFGRPLGLAALRGKLGHEGEVVAAAVAAAPPAPPEPIAPPAPVAPPEPIAPPEPVARLEPVAPAAPVAPPEPVTPAPVASRPVEPPVVPPPAPVVAAPAEAPPAAEAPARPRQILPPSLDEPWATTPSGAETSGEVEIRLKADHVHVETEQERSAREALLERLAAKNAQWWIRARTAYKTLAARDVSPANAAREALSKFPYLLSVPLQNSVEFAGGKLAEGYAILLQRIEKEEADFVETALTRLNPQFTTGGKTDTYPLGQELYLYVVAQGRLYKTFPEFLKEVLGHVLPEPGIWVQGSITEGDEATQILLNGATPGSTAESTRRLTDARERAEEHKFAVSTGPLTTRVFTLQADALKQPLDVDIKLTENQAPSDKAWIIPMPVSGRAEPRRHRAGGSTVEGFGKDVRSIVVALFNSDPNTEKKYELGVALKGKGPLPGKLDPTKPAARQSPFAARRS
jgi:hypothetical protein